VNTRDKPPILVSKQAVQNPEVILSLKRRFQVIELDINAIEDQALMSKVECIWIHFDFCLDESFLKQIPKCKFVLTTTTGLTHISPGAKSLLGLRLIDLTNFRIELESVTSTAELALSFIFHSQLNLDPIFQQVNSGNWSRELNLRSKQISSLAIGIVGLGRLGSIVAKSLAGIGANIYFCEIQNERIERGIAEGYTFLNSIQELCEISDIVSIHANTETDSLPIFTKETFFGLESSTVLINTSRARLVDEGALIDAIRRGTISKFYTDVLATEDTNERLQNSAVWRESQSNSNIYITPHIGGATTEAMDYCENLLLNELISRLDS
jgi:D-3-phosphoglycerate dehydrogenase